MSTTKVPQSMLDAAVPTMADLQNAVPAGTILLYAGPSAPPGWLFCNGQVISRVDYFPLFATIGISFGAGDGVNTFALPDFRGRVPIGQDDMGGVASADRITTAGCGINGDTLGAAGGSEFMQQHNHTLTDPGHTHSTPVTDAPATAGAGSQGVSLGNSGSSTTGITLADAGTGASGNVQPSLVVNYIIRAI